MDAILKNVLAAAQVLGVPVLVFVILVMAWACAMAVQGTNKIIMEMQYERKKRKDAQREIDNLNSSWIMEPDVESEYQSDTYDTLELPDISEQLVNYQEDLDDQRRWTS